MRWLFLGAAIVVLIGIGLGLLVAPNQNEVGVLDNEEEVFLGLINNYRAENGLNPLVLTPLLEEAAQWMSEDMKKKEYFSHTDSQGRDPFQRMKAFGYNFNTWKGENLAYGVLTGKDAFVLWKESPGHNANMLNPQFIVMGIGKEEEYWTTDFGGYVPVSSTFIPTSPPTEVPVITEVPIPATPICTCE